MVKRLYWNKLLSDKRCRERTSKVSSNKDTTNIYRNAFEADYDRIVGSSSVRRLQDKAQVFPLQENDFVRTRLTHSIEVSSLARSLGKAVGKEIEKNNDETFTSEDTEKLSALLQVAGLIHDLGNPPFGHYGETVIRAWFKKWFDDGYPKLELNIEGLKEGTSLTNQEKNDFIFFDGNVQNLRIVTKLQTLNDAYGANFTYGTLSTIMKYPWSSKNIKDESMKYGYYASEENLVKEIWKETGLSEGVRHPATYLLEAADDIIYICDDIEDGVKKAYIDWKKEYSRIKEIITDEEHKRLFEGINKKVPDASMDIYEKELAEVRNFRNAVQSYLFMKAKKQFLESYDEIMSGKFKEKDLLFREKRFIDELKSVTSRNCFGCKEVLELELVGDRVLKTLLDIFVPTILNGKQKEIYSTKEYAGKLYKEISANFKYIASYDYDKNVNKDFNEITLYDKIHLVVDFLAGMTDSYAVNLYKKLMGIELP